LWFFIPAVWQGNSNYSSPFFISLWDACASNVQRPTFNVQPMERLLS
jgi:hypothetical protein